MGQTASKYDKRYGTGKMPNSDAYVLGWTHQRKRDYLSGFVTGRKWPK